MENTLVWIYQLSSKEWNQGSYRSSVVEGGRVSWPVGRRQSTAKPEMGDRMVCWWAKTQAAEHGVVGWGVIEGETYNEGVLWSPRPPSDRWAMSPLVSPELETAIDEIRGGMKQATLYLAEGDLGRDLLMAIREADW